MNSEMRNPVVVVVVLPSNADSLKGWRGGHVSGPLPLTPRIPRHRAARPAVPGGIAAFPLSCLCVTELRVRFLGTRTKIHAADDPPFAFAYGS